MKTFVLLSSLLTFLPSVFAQNEAPVVHTLDQALRDKTRFLNPDGCTGLDFQP